jgi:hypothetical protein
MENRKTALFYDTKEEAYESNKKGTGYFLKENNRICRG